MKCVYFTRSKNYTCSESLLSFLLFLLLVQLLHKLSVRAADGSQRLLRMIKNPVSDHLPAGCPRYATSFKAGDSVCPRTLVPKDGPAVVVIGAFAHGTVGLSSRLLNQWFSNHNLRVSQTRPVVLSQCRCEAWTQWEALRTSLRTTVLDVLNISMLNCSHKYHIELY